MKKILFFFLAWIYFTPVLGQEIREPVSKSKPTRFVFKLVAGTTFTMVSDFNHDILIAEQLLIPNLISPENSAFPLTIVNHRSRSKSMVGWFAEAEVGYRLPKNYLLSFSAGVKKLRYDYQSEFRYASGTVNLDDLNREFGRTTLLYLNVTPFNISKGFLQNRLTIQAGPTVSWLLDSEVMNTLVIYNSFGSQESGLPDRVYFDTTGKFTQTLIGLNLGIEHTLIGPVCAKLSGQYYFNSLSEEEGLYKQTKVEKTFLMLIQGAITVAF
jgi:hypothetical protein